MLYTLNPKQREFIEEKVLHYCSLMHLHDVIGKVAREVFQHFDSPLNVDQKAWKTVSIHKQLSFNS
jgi:hypothetical protein